MFYQASYKSPLGEYLMASDGLNLVGLWLVGQKYFGLSAQCEIFENAEIEIFKRTKIWLDEYFAGKCPEISNLPIAPIGNEFCRSVWKILCEIPYGKVTTYGEIASKIASQKGVLKMSAQAIGGAVGRNPISIIIPCHRVVGKNGDITGYAGGIDVKAKLLCHEGVELDSSNLRVVF